MTEQSLTQDNDRGALGPALRRRWWLVAVVAVVLAAVGLAAGLSRPASYTATTTVLVKPVPGLPFSPSTSETTTGQNVTMTTEAALIASQPVLAAANSKLGTSITPGDGTVSATVPPNSQTIQISYTAGNAAKAQKGADTLAQAYLDYRAGQAKSITSSKTQSLQSQISAAQTQLDAASKAASAAVPEPQAAGLVQLYSSTLVSLQQSLATNQAVSLDAGTIIAPATLPTSTATLTTALFGVGGLVLGLVLGLLVALVLALRDHRLRGGETQVAGVPVLAAARSDREVAAMVEQVRTAVVASSGLPVSVGVLGADATAAAGLTLALGEAMSEAGYRVAVVEADPDAPTGATGLGELLTSTDHGSTPLERRGAVAVLPAGRALATHADLLGGPRMGQIVADLRGDYDVVLVALPSTERTLGLATARHTDETILLTAARRGSSDTIGDVVRQADLLGIRLLGLVIGPDGGRGLGPRPAPARSDARDDEHVGLETTPSR